MPIADHERLTSTFFRGVNSPLLFRRFFDGFRVWSAMGLAENALPKGDPRRVDGLGLPQPRRDRRGSVSDQ